MIKSYIPDIQRRRFLGRPPEWITRKFCTEYHCNADIREERQKLARLLYYEWNMKDRLRMNVLPFSETPSDLSTYLVQIVSTLYYFIKRYPHYLSEPVTFNHYLSCATRWELPSVPSIFRDCFDHLPLSPEKENELNSRKQIPTTPIPWHWPIPPQSEDWTLLPDLPRPDKFTFARAMEYASKIGDADFAREVWYRREPWRALIDQTAIHEIEQNRWSEFLDDEVVRYEHHIVHNFTSTREWAKVNVKSSERTDGASATLYEGYTRLLFIQTLAFAGHCDEAFAVVLQGTGEKYGWTSAMLTKVRTHAEMHGHWALVGYIDNLEGPGPEDEMQSLHDWVELEENDIIE
jgi:hypothetical protein